MRAIVKNKNILEFHLDKHSPYKFDVNTGTWYGLRGMEIENAPVGVKQLIIENKDGDNNIIRLFYFRNYHGNQSITNITQEYKEYFPILDKLTSIGYRISYDDINMYELDFVNQHMKEFAIYVQSTDRPNLGQFRREGAKNIWLKQFEPYFKKNPHITTEMKNFVYEILRYIPENEIETVFYFISKNGLYNFFNSTDKEYVLRDSIEKYFIMINFLGIKPNKEPFIQEFVKVEREYQAKKLAKDNKDLYEFLREHEKAFTFSDDKYMVVIPETTDDIIKESKQQHNCVSGYIRHILNKHTNIVFVRSIENPDKSLVTVEIDNDGYIVQFLLGQNQNVIPGTDLHEFHKKWQTHIHENWRK